jgi:hypothetical protein
MIKSIVAGIASGIITPIAGIFNKKADVNLEKYRVDGQINIEAMRADVELTKATAEVAKARKDDPTDRWGRRLFIYPTGVWFSAIVADSLLHQAFEYTYRVEALPKDLAYIPYTVIGYLFLRLIRKL